MKNRVFELIKLALETLTPILILVFGIKIDKIIKKHENIQWTNQKILEKRLYIYDDVIFLLNDIFCFHCYIGNWKEVTPIMIIDHKRKLDKILNSYAPLFTKELLEKYNDFMNECYKMFTGWGNDAKIKTLYTKRKEYNKNWEEKWMDLFMCENIKNDDDEKYSINKKKEKYQSLMEEFKKNLEIFKPGDYGFSDTPSINFMK